MKFNAGNQSVSVSFIGTEDKISEIILYGGNNTSGFGIARILGKKMNPNDLMTIIKVLEKSKINMDQFKPLFNNIKD